MKKQNSVVEERPTEEDEDEFFKWPKEINKKS
jgi:hypothetical protein